MRRGDVERPLRTTVDYSCRRGARAKRPRSTEIACANSVGELQTSASTSSAGSLASLGNAGLSYRFSLTLSPLAPRELPAT